MFQLSRMETNRFDRPEIMNKDIIKFAHLNIQSLNNKIDELKNYLAVNKIAIMSINETWLSNNSKINIPNYSIVRKERPNGQHGGGVCILVHKTIRFTQETILSGDSLEYVLIKIKNQPIKDEYLTILSYYSPPSTTISKNFLIDAFSSFKNLIVFGDLNAHHTSWHSSRNNASGNSLDDLFANLNCVNINYELPTYQPMHRPDYFAILDFIIVSDVLYSNMQSFQTSDLFRSDHLTLEIEFKSNSLSQPIGSKTEKIIQLVDWNSFGAKLSSLDQLDSAQICTKESLETAVLQVTKEINESIKEATHTKTISVNPNKFMVLPAHIIKIIKAKRLARRNYQKYGDPKFKTEFNRLNFEIKESIRKFKQEKWRSFCNSLNLHKTSDSKLWDKLNSIDKNKNEKPPKIPPLSVNNTSIDNPTEISNIFAEILAKTFSDPNDPNFNEDFKELISQERNKTDFLNTNPTEIIKTNQTEVEIIIKNLRAKGAPGIDQIRNKALKHLPSNIILTIVRIINASMELAYFPQTWKHAIVSMIPKPMKDPKRPENYRPISLLNTLSKLCERVIQSRLNYWISENNILSNFQSGFVKGKQTNDHLFRLIESTLIGFNKGFKKGLKTAAIFIDIEKAFDNVWHTGLLYKLHQHRVPNYLGNWIGNYITNRTFQVKCGNELSNARNVEAGIPQGSVLGPTLFNIFFNDISEIKSDQSTLGMFADDVATWVRHHNLKFLEEKLQINLNNIQEWSAKWRLKISANKTTYNIFNRKNQNINSQIHLEYNGNRLNSDPNPKFLGITLDPGLRFSKHINIVRERSTKRLNILRSIKGKNWGASEKLFIATYKTLIRSIIEYAPFIPSIISSKDLNKLEAIQRKAVKIGLNLPFRTHNDQVESEFSKVKLETIRQRSKFLTRKYLMKTGSTNQIVRNQLVESIEFVHNEKCKKRPTILNSVTFK
jgi:hypothetical protein